MRKRSGRSKKLKESCLKEGKIKGERRGRGREEDKGMKTNELGRGEGEGGGGDARKGEWWKERTLKKEEKKGEEDEDRDENEGKEMNGRGGNFMKGGCCWNKGEGAWEETEMVYMKNGGSRRGRKKEEESGGW